MDMYRSASFVHRTPLLVVVCWAESMWILHVLVGVFCHLFLGGGYG